MSAYILVIRHAVGHIIENTAAQREGVYAKARRTLIAKLSTIDGLSGGDATLKQLTKLEDAIRLVEAEFAARETAIASLGTPAHLPHRFGVVTING